MFLGVPSSLWALRPHFSTLGLSPPPQDPLSIPGLLTHVGPGPLDWGRHVAGLGAFTPPPSPPSRTR